MRTTRADNITLRGGRRLGNAHTHGLIPGAKAVSTLHSTGCGRIYKRGAFPFVIAFGPGADLAKTSGTISGPDPWVNASSWKDCNSDGFLKPALLDSRQVGFKVGGTRLRSPIGARLG
jgi:hypothetical protein